MAGESAIPLAVTFGQPSLSLTWDCRLGSPPFLARGTAVQTALEPLRDWDLVTANRTLAVQRFHDVMWSLVLAVQAVVVNVHGFLLVGSKRLIIKGIALSRFTTDSAVVQSWIQSGAFGLSRALFSAFHQCLGFHQAKPSST